MKLQQENIPDGYHEIKNVTGVYRKDGHIVVCGVPDFDDETHNCDHMGCSSVSHVLFRCCCGQLPEVGYKEPRQLNLQKNRRNRLNSPSKSLPSRARKC